MSKKTPCKQADSFVTMFVDRLIRLYLDVVREKFPADAKLLQDKIFIQNEQVFARDAKKKRMAAYINFWNGLSEEQQFFVASHDAKINHLSRLARTFGTTEVVQAYNKISAQTAESIDFVLRRFKEEGVTPAQLQNFLDENAVAWFSLTGHPTNPTTLAYTIAQIKVAAVLANQTRFDAEDLKNALRVLRDTPIVGAHKTPLDEAEETLSTLDVIYDSALACRALFHDALEVHGFAAQGVQVKKPLTRPCAWTLGDGDGNESLTPDVLERGIALHRRRIASRYQEFFTKTVAVATHSGMLPRSLGGLEKLAAKIATASSLDEDGVIVAVKSLMQDLAGTAVEPRIKDFLYLFECFGLGFGKIDLRHNAIDIMETVAALADSCGLMRKEIFFAHHMDEKARIFTSWLEDGAVLRAFEKTNTQDLIGNDTAMRILGRLRVIGSNLDMCEKLIVAETTHPAHILAAMLLLKISGNDVGTEKSRIDLVVLSESVADLVGLGAMIETLLNNATFRQHVCMRKRLLVMIAKSDTTRQDGRGEAEYAQYEAAVDIYRIADVMKRKYPELEPVLVSIKNGGGHALQRGGGRVTEIPALHGRAAFDARATDIGPSTLTIQGQQQTILFCPGKTAIGTMEALASHNLYTKAGIQGEMQPPPFSKNINKQYARADARLYAKIAGVAFDALTKESSAIDELLVHAPWLSMKAGNVSSRPAKRGEKPVGPGVTPAEAKGDNPRALAGRAISGERLSAHACLPIFSVLGLLEAMEAVRGDGAARKNPEKYGDALHHLYRAHKVHRDAARATVNAAAMADFDIAWPLLAARPRPRRGAVEKLARRFVRSSKPYANKPEVTLAWLEMYFLSVEKLTYEMISGQKAKKSFCHGEALRHLWPELAAQVDLRDRGAEFARVIECHRSRQFDAMPDTKLGETAFRITQALYAGANVVNAPVGILATRTRLEPVYEVNKTGKTRFMRPESYGEDKVAHLLTLPKALEA